MGFFNAAFRLGVIQGFQNRQEEIAEEQEKLLEEDKRVARKASATMASIVDKRKRLRQNRENIFAITSNIAPEGADNEAIKNLFKQKENTDGSPITENTARRLLESMTVDQINAFMPVEEPAPESPPETEEEESGPGFLAAVFSPTARAAARREKIFQKPPGVSEEEWMAALADQDIPAYGEPSQPVATPEQIKDLQDFTLTDTNKAVALLATGFPDMTERELQNDSTKAKLLVTIGSMLKKPDRTFEGNPLAREYNSRNITELPSDVRTLADLTTESNREQVLRSLKEIGVKGTIEKLQERATSTSPNDTQSGQPENNAQESDDMVEISAELKEKIQEIVNNSAIQLTPEDRSALKKPKVRKSILDKYGIKTTNG